MGMGSGVREDREARGGDHEGIMRAEAAGNPLSVEA